MNLDDRLKNNQAAAEGVDLTADDPLPDVPDAGDSSVPITSPNPIDFSTKGIAAAGSAGMSTFNDGDDQGLFERSVDVFEEGDMDSPMLGDEGNSASRRRARIYSL